MKKNLHQITKRCFQMIRFMIVLITLVVFGQTAYSQITAPNVTRCGEGTVTLRATTTYTGGALNWYDVPFYGASLGTGEIFVTPALQENKTYYVDYVINGVGICARQPLIATISANSIQASIFYETNTFCKSVETALEVTRTGTAGGLFTYTGTGTLTLNTSTGAITPNTSDVGTYSVTYTVSASAGCVESPTSTTIYITTAPVTPTISYAETPVCTTHATLEVTHTGATGGTYSASPSGLTVNASSGAITPVTSITGTYTITYFVSGTGGCAPQTATTEVRILQLPTASISYATPFCNNSGSHPVTLTGSGLYTGGAFTATGELTIDETTGEITPSAGGTYTIYYTLTAVSPCTQVIAQTTVTVYDLPAGTLSGTTAVCSGGSATLSVALSGTAPWSFTYTDGATPVTVVDQQTTPYTVVVNPFVTTTYTLTAISDAHCSGAASGSAIITMTQAPQATFEYSNSPYCSNGTNPSPNMLGVGTKGNFSSAAGLIFADASAGVIDLSASTAGTYTITNTIASSGGCDAVSATSSVTITVLPVASFSYVSESYPDAAYCTNVTNPLPIMAEGAVKGIFSSTSGLEFKDVATGEIKLSACTPGTYTVTNTIAAGSGCGVVTETTSVVIKLVPAAYAGFNRGICAGASTTLGGDAISGNTYSWTSDPSDASLTQTTISNPTVSPTANTTYTLTESNSVGCTKTTSMTVNILARPAANPIIGTDVLCAGSSSVAYNFTTDNLATGAFYGWSYSGTGATLSSTTASSITIDFATNATSGTLTVLETSFGCSTPNTMEITVNPLPTATISGTNTVCQNTSSPSVTFTGAMGIVPYTFIYKINGGEDLTVVTTEGNSITVAAPTSTAGVFTYSLVSVRDASNTTCLNAQTGSAVITIDQLTIAAAGNDQTLCNTATFTMAAVPTVGTGAWTFVGDYGTAAITTSSSATTTVTGLVAGTTATVKWTVTNGTCSAYDEVVLINTPLIAGNTSGSDVTICNNTTTTLTGGTATGGNGGYTYLWESCATEAGTYSAAAGTNNEANYTTSTLTTENTLLWFRRTVTSSACSSVAAAGKVTVNPDAAIALTSAAETKAQTLCINTPLTNITYSVTGGGTGAGVTDLPTGVAGGFLTGVFTISGTPSVAGTFNYTVTTTGTCDQTTATGTITVGSAAGTSQSDQTICSGNSPANLTLTGTVVGSVIRWESDDNAEFTSPATLAVAANTLTSAQMGPLIADTWFRAVVQSGACAEANSSSIKVTVTPLPNPTFTTQPGAVAIRNTDATYTTESGKASYVWTYTGSAGTDYTITSGGGNTNSVILKWLTDGDKTVTVNYGNASGCIAAAVTSSTTTNVRLIGSSYLGGKLFYILQPGDTGHDYGIAHGLIVSDADLSSSAAWWNGVNTTTGATATALGTGSANTMAIISSQGNTGGHAAKLCRDYAGGGYSDWFLPSKDELNKVWENRVAIGEFATNDYWSSSEVDLSNATVQYFSEEYSSNGLSKNSTRYVRAIRSF